MGPHRLTDRHCEDQQLEIFAYLKATLKSIFAGHPASRIDELLPWNFTSSS
ncbi:transposase domain-containing protein [uncultured Tateyamaria sp.]|uniref:transposase domain-containing protein n=1 Tax=uncultured Tateyamaria sp. TaxID=455651 RepID=UPI00345C1D5C